VQKAETGIVVKGIIKNHGRWICEEFVKIGEKVG
jgi:hypothetical protein